MKFEMMNKMYEDVLKKIVFFLLVLLAQVASAQQKMGDNLGNHKASLDLNMNTKDVKNVQLLNAGGVVIGTATAVSNSSVALQITGSDKAMLVPRVTNLLSATSPSIPISNALNGMMVYDLATNKFYVRQNGAWTTFATPNLPNGQIWVGNASSVAAPVTPSGDLKISNTGVTTIQPGVVTTAKLKDGSVTLAKLGTAGVADANSIYTTNALGVPVFTPKSNFVPAGLASGRILVGNASNVATAVAVTGDLALSNAGVLSINDNAVVTAKIKDAAVTVVKLGTAGATDANKFYTTNSTGTPVLTTAISATNIANGSVDDTEFSRLDNVTSNIQTQIDNMPLGYVPIGSVIAWFPNLTSTALPSNFVMCNGQVLSDAGSKLNGVTIPNLNGGSYLTGVTSASGSSVGSNTLLISAANLPKLTLTATTTAVSAGTPSGTITVASAGAHTHTLTRPATSLRGDNLSGTNGGDGLADAVNNTTQNGEHTHSATFSGTAIAAHTHPINVNLNPGTQTALDNRPLSTTVCWIMRVK